MSCYSHTSHITHLAALRCTTLIWLVCVAMWGSQTLAAYSSSGRITALYAVRSCWFLVGIFLRKMSRVLLALFVTRLMFLLQFRSSDISTPRYQADEVFTYTCPSSMYLVQMSSGYRYMDNLTLPYPTVFRNAQIS